MKLTLTYTITVTHTIDTNEAGYSVPEDAASCVAEQQNWLDEGDVHLEDMDFTGAVVTVTGVQDETNT